MEIRQVKAEKILNPTSIDLGDYVINPYKGCAYGCLYCYARFNRVNVREKRIWGEYIDARINAPALLEKELFIKKPRKVLIGSTTECMGPYERKFRLSSRIFDLLNKNKVYFSVLTRSPIISDYVEKLNKGYCQNIYFTVNCYDEVLKERIEPKSPDFGERAKVVNQLIDKGLPIIPYCSPVLPYITRVEEIFDMFSNAGNIEFEGLNFNLGNMSRITQIIESLYPKIGRLYRQMRRDDYLYDRVWNSVRGMIVKEAIKNKKNHNIYTHKLHAYFHNKYSQQKNRGETNGGLLSQEENLLS